MSKSRQHHSGPNCMASPSTSKQIQKQRRGRRRRDRKDRDAQPNKQPGWDDSECHSYRMKTTQNLGGSQISCSPDRAGSHNVEGFRVLLLSLLLLLWLLSPRKAVSMRLQLRWEERAGKDQQRISRLGAHSHCRALSAALFGSTVCFRIIGNLETMHD